MNHSHVEKTFVIIKPDGVARGLVGDVISRFERAGLHIVQMKMMQATEELVKQHYTLDAGWKKAVGEKTIADYVEKGIPVPSNNPIVIADELLHRLATYMTSGPVVALEIEGIHAVKMVRKIVGNTEPYGAAVGTIRGDYSLDSYQIAMDEGRSLRNIVHASGTLSEVEAEVKLWFGEGK